MGFENLKDMIRVGCGPISCLKLSLAAALTSRPYLNPGLGWFLRLFADDNGVVWSTAICKLSQQKLHYGFRICELPSDVLSFYEHCVRNCYQVDSTVKPDALIDGGANTGLFSLAILSRWPEVRTIAVEPLPGNIAIIGAHLYRNNLTAQVLSKCLAARSGEVRFYVREANRGGLDGTDQFHHEIIVTTLPLSELYAPLRGSRVLIKLDIEGAEIPVLEEFLRTSPIRSKVVGELHHWKRHRARLVELFRAAGWSVSFFSEDSVCVLFSAQTCDWND
jgi:FkbM family methyltransferase